MELRRRSARRHACTLSFGTTQALYPLRVNTLSLVSNIRRRVTPPRRQTQLVTTSTNRIELLHTLSRDHTSGTRARVLPHRATIVRRTDPDCESRRRRRAPAPARARRRDVPRRQPSAHDTARTRSAAQAHGGAQPRLWRSLRFARVADGRTTLLPSCFEGCRVTHERE